MPQPIKKTIPKKIVKENVKKAKKDAKIQQKQPKKHQEYGTSKLEKRFAKKFLEKLGVKYEYQFKAESIGRYFDFYLPDHRILIEVDGDFYHSYGLVYEEMSPMQKKNHRVDKEKDHWALINGIPLIRIWEHDINKHQEDVMKMLKERLSIGEATKKIIDNKKKRH